MKGYWKYIPIALLVLFSSCGEKEDDTGNGKVTYSVTIDPSVLYQEMVGFGGALTWYSDRIISSPGKTAICQLLFDDLGMDILRLKNWYYPLNYPADKSSAVMLTSGMKTLFETTNQLYTLARQYDPDMQVLLSSWGPPPALKSNGSLNNKTLAKDNNGFVYQAFADYWYDILDHITFSPDYISIQNEPSWGTDNWESCVWRPAETAEYPGYGIAFEKVYDKIKTRANPPKMIGPESENIGLSSFGGNTFCAFSDVIKEKSYLTMYGYHTYNFSPSTNPEEVKSLLEMIKTSYGNKPNIMTEYSGMSWMESARFIIKVLNYANASGYIYWDMVWGETDKYAMIGIDYSGNYICSGYYFMMKHFAKHIDAGYHRIDAESSVESPVDFSAFLNAQGNKITFIAVNPIGIDVNIKADIAGKSISSVSGVKSTDGSFYNDLGSLSPADPLLLKANSISTFVLEIN